MNWTRTAAALCGALSINAAVAADAPAPLPITITWGGYVKLDALYSKFSEGEVAQGTSRDYYVPGTIPVGTGGQSHQTLDLHAKETRLFIKTATSLDNGDKIGTHVEFDFIVSQGAGTEVVTNAYNPGLRRAFVTYNNWTLGQDWSTFVNLGALPETLDFVGFPTDGSVFMRQPVARYTLGALQVSLENPETTVLNGGGTVVATDDGSLPDIVGRFEFAGLAVAALVRQLKIDNDTVVGTLPVIEDSTFGFGASVSGKVPVGPDDIRFTMTSGKGISRYQAIGTAPDTVIDASSGTPELKAVGVTNGYVAYRRAWSDKWRSTLTLSTLQINNDTALTGTGVTSSVKSVSVNLLYSPAPKVTVGAELRHATRELESGVDGALDRLQFSTKYAF